MPPSSSTSQVDLSKLLSDVNELVKAANSGTAGAREAAVSSCLALASALETPSEAIVRMTWTEPSHIAILCIAVNISLFESLAAEGGSSKTSAQLGKACSADPGLIARMLKHLAAMGTVLEVDGDSYIPTPLSMALTQPMFRDSILFMHNFCIPTNLKTAGFFAEHGYTSPTDALDTPVQYTFNAKGKTHMFGLLEQAGQVQGLASMMDTWMIDRPHWSDDELGFYPVQDRLISGAIEGDDAVFLVDVGGSKGHDMEKFLARHAFNTFPGRLVLQDRAEVIDSVPENSLSPGVEATVHDFFTPQPIQGARAYFLHNIIHDHPDEHARVILKQIKSAMKRGYSKLILWDFVLPEKGVPPTLSSLDWEMMTFYAAGERSEGQWKSLLEAQDIGLRINGIWSYSQFDQSVIEAELA